MSADLERTEADYEVRLTERVRAWEKLNPAEAERLRQLALGRIGMLNRPDPTSIRAMVLERAFREEVRKIKGWPTAEQWIKGSA